MPNLSDLKKAKSSGSKTSWKKSSSKASGKTTKSTSESSSSSKTKEADKAKISSENKQGETKQRRGFSGFLDQLKSNYGKSKAEPAEKKAWGKRPTAVPKEGKPDTGKPKKGLLSGAVELAKETSKDPKIQDQLAERKKEEGNHLRNLESHYSLFDNPGGGKTDGTISLKDIQKVAEGDYDADSARQKLRDQGVPESEIDHQIKEAQDTASYLLENDGFRGRLDKANDKDSKTDDKIGRGDLDKILVDTEKQERENRIEELERKANEPPSEEHLSEARSAVERWSKPGALSEELKEKPLSEFSAAELDALAAVNQNDPKAQEQIEQAVVKSVQNAESLDDLPQGDAFNHLLQTHVTGKEIKEENKDSSAAKAQEQLSGLVKDELEAKLDERLHDRKGDSELDLALERYSGNLEDLIIENPALLPIVAEQAEVVGAEYSDEFTDVARRDDNALQKANHAITGGFRDGVGFVTDAFREGVALTARISSAPTRLAGRAANFGLDVAGEVTGAGLDAVGADGAADRVRNATDKAGDLVQSGADFVADQNEGFTNGLGESVAGTVDGLAYVVTDPVGTVQGIGNLIQDPSLLLEGYKETLDEHGASGVAGQVVGDVALTVLTGGGGAAAKGSGLAGRFANFASRGGRTGRVLARGANGAQRFLNVLDDPASAASRLSARTGAGNGRFATGVSRAAERGEAIFRGVGRGRQNTREFIREQVGRGFDQLDNIPGVEKLKEQARRATQSLRRSDTDDFARSSREFQQNNPEVIQKIDEARTAAKDLSGASPEQLDTFIREHLDLARELDELSGDALPKSVGDEIVSGRANVLEYIRKDLPNLDPDQARRLIRGVLADSDPSSSVTLTRLSSEDRVFRAFDADNHAKGGYFGLAEDADLTPRQLRDINALTEDNRANRGVIVEPEDGSLAIVSRVGPQDVDNSQFQTARPGGGVQVQFLDPERLNDLLKQVADHKPRPGMPVVPIRIVNPRPTPVTPPVGRPAIVTDEEALEAQMDELAELLGSFVR